VKVTFVNKYYPPHLGGIEFHLRDLAEALETQGVQTRVLVSNEGSTTVTELVNGVHVTRLGRAFSAASTPVALGMGAAIRKESRRSDAPDLFHLHFPYPWGEVSWLRAKVTQPTVMTYHSDIVRQRVGLAAYVPILERVLDRVDVIIASSPNMVEHSPYLSKRADKCRVIPFGIHIERFQTTPERIARAAELRSVHERPVVLFVGRLIYYKGADVLVEAMKDVDADLVMIGRGPLEDELRQKAVEYGIADRVTFLSPVDDAELAAWYRAADVFCLPSVARSEAFGLVQLEAHASGTPVVSTSLTTGVPWVNQDGLTGRVVAPGDAGALAAALQELIEDDLLRARMGEKARERTLRGFSTARMVDDTLALYCELAGGDA